MIKNINYQSNNGWCSLRVKVISGYDKQDTLTMSGVICEPEIDKIFVFNGELDNSKYGLQLKFQSAKQVIPETVEGMERYLSGGKFKGIGKKIAKRLVEKFGAKKILDVIENEPEKLLYVDGITGLKIKSLIDGVKADKVGVELQKICGGVLTDRQILKITQEYKENSVNILKKNPYKLIYDIDGFGFTKCDNIAKGVGIKEYDDFRIQEGVIYTLKQISENEGHTYAYLEDFSDQAISVLFPLKLSMKKQKIYNRNYGSSYSRQNAFEKAGFTREDYEAIREYEGNKEKKLCAIGNAIRENIKNKKVIYESDDKGNHRLYWSELFEAENNSAKILSELCNEKPIKLITHIDKKIEIFEKEKSKTLGCEFKLEEEQKEAIKNALNHRLSVITGGAGVGKTTILECILYIWNDEDNIVLSAPTGKASQRMREATNRDATTIHLRIARQEEHKKKLAVIDESSMLDISLAEKTLNFFKDCQIIFIGDMNQLPSVSAGSFFQDLCNCEQIFTSKLSKGHRNQGNIAKNSKRINEGKTENSFTYGKDFEFREVSKEYLMEEIISVYKNFRKTFFGKDVMLLCPQKQFGTASVNKCNEIIEKIENAKGRTIKGCNFKVGDRVMCIRNDHQMSGREKVGNKVRKIKGIFNGDVGKIIRFIDEDNIVVFQTDDNRQYLYSPKEMNDFVLSYAMTIHKSQGSEYPVIIMPFNMESYLMLKRNILYTGVTRAKKHIVLIGEKKAINMAVRNTEYNERNSLLVKRIEKYNSLKNM